MVCLRNQFLVDGYNLSDHTVERICAHIGAVRLPFMDSPPCWNLSRDEYSKPRRQIRPGMVRTAWNGGEMLFPEQCELFRQAFEVPLFNRYGGRELSVMACQFSEGGPLNVIAPMAFSGDPERSWPPGCTGRSWPPRLDEHRLPRNSIPSLRCRGPGYVSRRAIANESGVAAIDQLHGRVSGLLELPGGRKINNIYWNHFFKEIKEVAQFQVILRKDGSLQILLRGEGFSQERDAAVRGLLAHFLGDIPVHLQWVERIPLSQGGETGPSLSGRLSKACFDAVVVLALSGIVPPGGTVSVFLQKC